MKDNRNPLTDLSRVLEMQTERDGLRTKVNDLERDRADLLQFLAKFLANFKPCDYCNGRATIGGDACFVCNGTGRKLESIGVLYVELIQEAEALQDAMRGKP